MLVAERVSSLNHYMYGFQDIEYQKKYLYLKLPPKYPHPPKLKFECPNHRQTYNQEQKP